MHENGKNVFLFIVMGMVVVFFFWQITIAPAKKYAELDPGKYDITDQSEIESYINKGKVYVVSDVRVSKHRSTSVVSVILEDDAGKRYTQNFSNYVTDNLSYKNLQTLISGDKVVVLDINKSWDINNLRRIRETDIIESEVIETEVIEIESEFTENTEIMTETEIIDTENLETTE